MKRRDVVASLAALVAAGALPRSLRAETSAGAPQGILVFRAEEATTDFYLGECLRPGDFVAVDVMDGPDVPRWGANDEIGDVCELFGAGALVCLTESVSAADVRRLIHGILSADNERGEARTVVRIVRGGA